MSRSPTSPFLFAAALASVSLVACTQAPDDQPDEAMINAEAAKATLDQLNQEREMLAGALTELKKVDPAISDLYFSLTDQGERTLTVVRDLPNGDVQTWQADPADVERILQPQQGLEDQQSANPGMGSMLMPMLGGMLAAYMVSNMFSRTAGQTATASREAHQRQRTMNNSAYSSSVSNKQRQSAMARSLSSPRGVGTSRGGSFSSSGSRSSGYSSGS